MEEIFDSDMELPIPCPECGYEIEMSIHEMENKPKVTCPSCGEGVTLDLDELEQTLDDMEGDWLDFTDDLE